MTSDAEIQGLMRLLTNEGRALLDDLPPIIDISDVLATTEHLRASGYEPELIAAALTQQRLRAKATSKFGPFAKDLWFTSDGLEQATRLTVAARHADRYRRAGATRVADLGCGIGTESFALAGLGLPVLAIDSDEAHAALTLVNLRSFPGCEVKHARIEDLDLPTLGVDAIFADPARRSGTGRTYDPESWSPPLSTILALRKQIANVGVKTAPGIPYGALPAASHTQWTSVGGSVVEAAIWCGDLALEGPGRSALVCDRDGAFHAFQADAETADAPATAVDPRELGSYLYEADGAIIRSGALSSIARLIGTDTGVVSADISYLTSDHAHACPGLTRYRVIEVLPAKTKTLASELKKREIGRLEILKRGMDISPDQLRRQLKLKGDQSGTVIMTRLRGDHAAILVEREID